MKMCSSHWDELKQAIREHRMWGLVAVNGVAASRRIQSELDGMATDSTYDPLMSAHWMICDRALESGGLYLLVGDICPLCEADKHGESPEEWISGCADSILVYVKEKNMPLDDEDLR